jgi:hypothetical protein
MKIVSLQSEMGRRRYGQTPKLPDKEMTMKYGDLTLGQVEALVNKLGGMEAVRRLLADEPTISEPTRVWERWRTIKLGTGLKSDEDFHTALQEADCEIGDCGNDLLGRRAFAVSPEAQEIELVVVSVGELGFKDGATRSDIYKRAQEIGLDLCPNEAGPQLRLQYKDQPKGELLLIAMEPITDSRGDLYVFNVERYGGGRERLDGDTAYLSTIWNAERRLVFQCRK